MLIWLWRSPQSSNAKCKIQNTNTNTNYEYKIQTQNYNYKNTPGVNRRANLIVAKSWRRPQQTDQQRNRKQGTQNFIYVFEDLHLKIFKNVSVVYNKEKEDYCWRLLFHQNDINKLNLLIQECQKLNYKKCTTLSFKWKGNFEYQKNIADESTRNS